MLTYSIAIRTLGKSGEYFRQELKSIALQTVPPERVIVYIACGYARPDYTIGTEEYVWVKKGMVAQRILPYEDINSDLILMLDDDVVLAPDSVERMIRAMEEQNADCVGADTFKNHEMSLRKKMYVAVTNLVFPHLNCKWAFKIRRSGSFSYNNRPVKSFYWSQSCAGNAMLWKKSVYKQLHLEDEMWLDELPFAYGDDMVESYKVYKNGFRLGVLYDSGCKHLNASTASRTFRKSSEWMCIRTMICFIVWWRTQYEPSQDKIVDYWLTIFSFSIKFIWIFLIMCGLSIVRFTPQYVVSYVNGLLNGRRFVHSDAFRSLRKYLL